MRKTQRLRENGAPGDVWRWLNDPDLTDGERVEDAYYDHIDPEAAADRETEAQKPRTCPWCYGEGCVECL